MFFFLSAFLSSCLDEIITQLHCTSLASSLIPDKDAFATFRGKLWGKKRCLCVVILHSDSLACVLNFDYYSIICFS